MNRTGTPDETMTAPARARLSDLENARAVDLIESAERADPRCVCGRHMIAVAHDGSVWLECSGRQGKAVGVFARLEAFLGHSRRRILDLPTSN